jgi:hypothetical protein
MCDPIHAPQQNYLLAALSAAEQERLYPHLQLVPMSLGKVLYESGDLLRHVYFPTDSIVSLLYVLADGRVGGNFGGRQRRPNWYRAVHGRGNHP